MRAVQFLMINAPKASNFLVVVTAVVLAEIELVKIRILRCLSLARSARHRQELLVIWNFENSLVLSILCIKEWSCFDPQQIHC